MTIQKMTTHILSAEEKWERVLHAWPLWVAVIVRDVLKKYGDEGRRLIENALRNQGEIQGKKVFVERMQVEPNVPGFIEALSPIMESMGEEWEIVEISEKRCIQRVTRCRLQERWKVVGAPKDIMCDIWDNYNLGFRRAINPTNPIHHYHLKQMYKGDPYCEVVWEIREG